MIYCSMLSPPHCPIRVLRDIMRVWFLKELYCCGKHEARIVAKMPRSSKNFHSLQDFLLYLGTSTSLHGSALQCSITPYSIC